MDGKPTVLPEASNQPRWRSSGGATLSMSNAEEPSALKRKAAAGIARRGARSLLSANDEERAVDERAVDERACGVSSSLPEWVGDLLSTGESVAMLSLAANQAVGLTEASVGSCIE